MAGGPHKNPTRNFRPPSDLWEQARVDAEQQDTNVSALLVEFLRWYVREPGARLPKRPTRDS